MLTALPTIFALILFISEQPYQASAGARPSAVRGHRQSLRRHSQWCAESPFKNRTASGSVVPETVWAPISSSAFGENSDSFVEKNVPKPASANFTECSHCQVVGPSHLKPLNGRRWSVKTCWGATELVCRPWGHGADGTSNHFCADSVHL